MINKILLIPLFLVGIVLWLIWRLSKPRWASSLSGPGSWDIFYGSRGDLTPSTRSKKLQRWSKEFGTLFYVKGGLMVPNVLVVCHPTDQQKVFNASNLEASEIAPTKLVLRPSLGPTKALFAKSLAQLRNSLHSQMSQVAAVLLATLPKTRDFFACDDFTSCIVLDILAPSLCDLDLDAIKKPYNSRFQRTLWKLSRLMDRLEADPFIQKHGKAVPKGRSYQQILASEIRSSLQKKKPSSPYLVSLKEQISCGAITLEDAVNNTVYFLYEGVEVTSAALSYILFLIWSHGHIREVIEEGINQIMGERKIPTLQDLEKFEGVQTLIWESLRLLPPRPVALGRTLQKEVKLRDDKVTVPAGTFCYIPFSAPAHNPNLWDEPLKWKPQRWENMESLKHLVLSFGDGNHSCLGREIAWKIAAFFIMFLLRNMDFSFEPSYKLALEYARVTKPLRFKIKVEVLE